MELCVTNNAGGCPQKGDRMVSRVRIEGHGRTLEECAADLKATAERIRPNLPGPVRDGDYIVERDRNLDGSEEPVNSVFAYKGRLVLHANLADNPHP